MKLLICLVAFSLIPVFLVAQDNRIEKLIGQGVYFHDHEYYDDAISRFKEALSIDSNSSLANYELSNTYMKLKKYNDALIYAKKSVEYNDDCQDLGYVILGSVYDMMNNPDESIKIFQAGLAKFPNSHPINYNLAITALNQRDYVLAEKSALNSVKINPWHPGSHGILANIKQLKGERVKSILAKYFFLMLEPNTERSKLFLNSMKQQFFQGVKYNSSQNATINIPNSNIDSTFSSAEFAISFFGAYHLMNEDKTKSEFENFKDITSSIFNVLSNKKQSQPGIWEEIYVSKFEDLMKTDLFETFCYYISQSTNSKEINNWIANNTEKINRLKDWINKY